MNFSLLSIAAKGAIYADCETTRLHNSATGSRAESTALKQVIRPKPPHAESIVG